MSKTFSVALSDELFARVQAAADARGIARNAFVREALEVALGGPPEASEGPVVLNSPDFDPWEPPAPEPKAPPEDCQCGHPRSKHAKGPGCRFCPCPRSF